MEKNTCERQVVTPGTEVIMENSIPDRYEKNPMLAVLENYVLDAIGKLEPDKAELLNKMICQTFGGTDWKKVVREQFDLPRETDDNLRAMWKQAQEEAEAAQEDLSPEEFARDVVDELFSDLGS
jgi:hypothetical protein